MQKDNDNDVLDLKIYALSKCLNPLSSELTISVEDGDIVGEISKYTFLDGDGNSPVVPTFFIDQSGLIDKANDIKSFIVCVSVDLATGNGVLLYPLFGRNVDGLANEDKFDNWEIIPEYK